MRMEGDGKPTCSLKRLTIAQAAERCASEIMGLPGDWSISVDSRGRVWVERFENASPDDVVGTYNSSCGLMPLFRGIREDLAYEWGVVRRNGVHHDMVEAA